MIEYYTSLDELPLWNFDRYLATNNNNWFRKDFDGRQPIIQNPKLHELEIKFQDDYFAAINDHGFLTKIRKWATLAFLETKYNVVVTIANLLKNGFSIQQQEIRAKYIKTLQSSGYRIPIINTPQGDIEEADKILNKIQSIKAKIAIIQDELKEDGKVEKQSLQRQLLIISQGLQLGYRLNPREITVSEYIEMTKMLQEKSKQN